MVLLDEFAVKLLSSRAGVSFIKSVWLCNEYHTKQEAFQALTSILTRGKYTSSPKAWLKSKGILVIFAQLAAVDVDLDPHPERDTTHEHNPVNAPVNAPKHIQVKSRIPERVTTLSFSKGMAELGQRWKLMEPDDIMSVAVIIQGTSKDGLIGKNEFIEFASLVEEVTKTQEYKNDPSLALEKLYVDLLGKKRQSAYNDFFAEWLSNSKVEGDSQNETSLYNVESNKFHGNARTLKTVQFQLEEMAAQARSDGLRPLVSFEHLLGKVRDKGYREAKDGGIPHTILTKFFESIGASVATGGSSSSRISPMTNSTHSGNESPFSFFTELMNGGHQSLLSPRQGSSLSTLGTVGPLPSFTFEAFTAPEEDPQASLKELQNNTAYISEKMSMQVQDLEFLEALKRFQALGGGDGTLDREFIPFYSLASAAATPDSPKLPIGHMSRDDSKRDESDIALRLKNLTVDTSWDRVTGEGGAVTTERMGISSPSSSPRIKLADTSMNTPKISTPMGHRADTPLGAKRAGSPTEGMSTASSATETRKVNLSIFKSPKIRIPQPIKKSPLDRLPVRLSACHGSAPATKAIISRAQKNRKAAEHAIVNKNTFK